MSASFHLNKKDWFEKYKQLSENESHHVLLESGRGGTYSIIGLNPFKILCGKGRELTIIEGDSEVKKHGPLLDLMEVEMDPYQVAYQEGLPPFQGGAIGYLSYDIVREFEYIPSEAEDDLKLPELYFMLFHDVFVYEHSEEKMWMIFTGEEHDEAALEMKKSFYKQEWQRQDKGFRDWHSRGLHSETRPVHPSMTEEKFAEAVNTIKDYISAGDVFQVNLSVRHQQEMVAEPLHVYHTLREINPSPYMSYFHTPDFQFVSASPELLVKKHQQEISTRPIAGTRSRGNNEAEDQRLADELLSNEKERAEHVMLVDLERNDLGRVAEYGSVEVNELLVIEKYSHVMHLVSNVRAKLKEDYNVYDVIRATFPGGTITGAPKIRTMEIIEELEPVRRGLYTGSIGWIGFNQEMELNITIRTIVCQNNQAYIQAGAGVVIDSNPDFEYKESLKKAKALWRALELSEEELRKKVEMS
ncbi:aminobenzoate synthetase [Alkalihalobacillus pseudalcaliphilus]|nr:aminobenzoate synthetase [Alkalihalobacillus pseudalcaliphilus]